MSYGITENIETSNISPGYKSDHSLISINFIPIMRERGKGFWKLNCSHLKDLDYVKLMKETITDTINMNKNANPNLLWDVVKMTVRGESIKYGSKIKKKRDKQMENLENQIQNLENRLSSCYDLTQEEINSTEVEIAIKKEQLSCIIKKKLEGAIIRSRIQWYEEGESNSKYFFNLEKRTSNIKSINRLQLANDTITMEPKTILLEMKHFYQTLFTNIPQTDHNEYFEKVRQPVTIPPDDVIKMEKEITEQEILKVVKSLPNNKTPGEDGLPSGRIITKCL